MQAMPDARQGKVLKDKIDSTKSSLQSSFQAGVDGIYNAITAQGTTPASKAQGDVNAIGTLATNKYNQGKNDVSLSVSGSYVNASNGKSARVDYKGQYLSQRGQQRRPCRRLLPCHLPRGRHGLEYMGMGTRDPCADRDDEFQRMVRPRPVQRTLQSGCHRCRQSRNLTVQTTRADIMRVRLVLYLNQSM